METLTEEAVETVLGRLSLRELLKASTVCKEWHRIITSSTLIRRRSDSQQRRQPWLFVLDAQAGALQILDPTSSTCLRPLPLSAALSGAQGKGVRVAAGDPGLLFKIAGGRLRHGWVSVRGLRWHDTPPMRWWRQSPVVCYMRHHEALLVAGGAWELDDDDEDDGEHGCLEIFSLRSRRWDTAEPLPRCFRRYTAEPWVRAASDGGDRAFVVQDSGGGGGGRLMWACFHMGDRRWGAVRAVRLPDGDGLVPRTLSLVGGTTLGLLVAGLTVKDGVCRALLWQLPDASDADAEPGDDMKAELVCEMPRSVTAAVVGLPLDPTWYSFLCVGSGDLLFFHSDRTYVVALCHLPTLRWSAFTVDPVVPVGASDGGGRAFRRSEVIACLSSKTVVCAPVTLDQVFSSLAHH